MTRRRSIETRGTAMSGSGGTCQGWSSTRSSYSAGTSRRSTGNGAASSARWVLIYPRRCQWLALFSGINRHVSEDRVHCHLYSVAQSGYENEIAAMVAKLLLKSRYKALQVVNRVEQECVR